VPAPIARPRSERWLAAAIAGVREAEHRARTAYLRLPAPVLAAADPAVRGVARAGRRTAAVPFYLRQPFALWTGTCGGEPGRVATGSPARTCAPHASRGSVGIGRNSKRTPPHASGRTAKRSR